MIGASGDEPASCRTDLSHAALAKIAGMRIQYELSGEKNASFWEILSSDGLVLDPSLLRAANYPLDLLNHLDSQGRFHLQTETPLIMVAENGDHPMDKIRMGVGIDDLTKTGEGILDEMSKFAELHPKIEFQVVVGPNGLTEFLPPPHFDESLRGRSHQKNLTFFYSPIIVSSFPTDEGKTLTDGRRLVSRPRVRDIGLPTLLLKNSLIIVKHYQLEEIVPSFFEFEGGDIVVGANRIFVGANSVHNNMSELGITQHDVVAGMTREWGKPVAMIDTSHRVIRDFSGHLDLLISLIRDRRSGEEVILVSSPRAAIKALESEASLAAADSDLKNRYLSRYNDDLKVWSQWLDSFREVLAKKNYRMIEVPFLAFHSLERNRAEQMINYVNTWASLDQVFLLQSGIRTLDRAAEKIYRALGYEIYPLSFANQSLCQQGGIRCRLAINWKFDKAR